MIWSAAGFLSGGLFESLNIWNSAGFVLVLGVFGYLLKRAAGAVVSKSVEELITPEEDSDGEESRSGTGTEDRGDGPDLGDREQFRRLTDDDFENKPTNPQNCWLRPFNLTEIRKGWAVERQHPDGDRRSVVTELVSELKSGDNRVVLGAPGAGKTTLCKQVAYRWHEDDATGEVVFREKREEGGVDLKSLKDKVESAKGGADDEAEAHGEESHVLVVAEDVARSDAIPVLEAAYDYVTDQNVSFLLESRETEWRDFDEVVRMHPDIDPSADFWQQILTEQGSIVEEYTVPDLDDTEVGRIADQFAEVTGRTVHRSKEKLYERIEAEKGASPLLLLAYHLHVGEDGTEDDVSALEENVYEVFGDIASDEDFPLERAGDGDLLAEVGLMVNLLNAVGIGVHAELLHALADDEHDHRKIDEFLDELDGSLLFGEKEGEGTRYWCHHELWSELYLAHHHEEASSERAARETFEDCVNALFSVVEREPSRYVRGTKATFNWLPVPRELETRTVREQIRDNVEGRTPKIDEIARDPGEHADRWVADVFELGERNLRIAPLFGTGDDSGIELPGSCSTVTVANSHLLRSRMLQDRGHHEESATELKQSFEIRTNDGSAKRAKAVYLEHRGKAARETGDYEEARDFNRRARDIHEDIGDRSGEANALTGLGLVACNQGDFEDARDFHCRARDVYEDIGDPSGEAAALNNLGIVARNQGDYEDARDFHRRARDIHEDIGHPSGEANALTGLGNVAFEQGDYEDARDFFRRARDIHENIGDPSGKATALNNLGLVAFEQGDYEDARDFFRHARDIHEDIGDPSGEANALGNLASLAWDEKDYDTAGERYEEAASIFADIGALRELLQTHRNLVHVCEQQGDVESAIEWCETGLSTIEDADVSGLEGEREQFEALLEQLRSQERPTEDLYAAALENVLDNEGGAALQFFRHAWEQRDEASADQHTTALAAGVGVAALIELFDDEGSDEETREILEEIEPDRDQLSDPVDVVFEYLAEGEVDTTPAELLESSGSELEDADEIFPDELSSDELETLAFAQLLKMLMVVSDYSQALQHILENDDQEAMQALSALWEQRDSIDEDAPEFSPVLAAGVGFAAHTRFFDDEQADADREEVLEEIAQHEDRLVQPELALYEYLTKGETDTTPEELRDEVGEDSEELGINDMEYIAYAGLLEVLQEQDEE